MYIEKKRQTENKEYLTVIAFQYVKIATDIIRQVAGTLHKRNSRTMPLTRDSITQWFGLFFVLNSKAITYVLNFKCMLIHIQQMLNSMFKVKYKCRSLKFKTTFVSYNYTAGRSFSFSASK